MQNIYEKILQNSTRSFSSHAGKKSLQKFAPLRYKFAAKENKVKNKTTHD
jgi:hypothetical protein